MARAGHNRMETWWYNKQSIIIRTADPQKERQKKDPTYDMIKDGTYAKNVPFLFLWFARPFMFLLNFRWSKRISKINPRIGGCPVSCQFFCLPACHHWQHTMFNPAPPQSNLDLMIRYNSANVLLVQTLMRTHFWSLADHPRKTKYGDILETIQKHRDWEIVDLPWSAPRLQKLHYQLPPPPRFLPGLPAHRFPMCQTALASSNHMVTAGTSIMPQPDQSVYCWITLWHLTHRQSLTLVI